MKLASRRRSRERERKERETRAKQHQCANNPTKNPFRFFFFHLNISKSFFFLPLFLEKIPRLSADSDAAASGPSAHTTSTSATAATSSALVRLEQPREHLVGASRRRRGGRQHGVRRKPQVPHCERGALEFFLEYAGRRAVDGAAEIVRCLEGVLDADEMALVALYFVVVVGAFRRRRF